MDRGHDEDEAEPPGEAATEGGEEGRAHVVDCRVGGVPRGEDDVPEEPAADGDEEGDGVGGGFGVRFYESGVRALARMEIGMNSGWRRRCIRTAFSC